MSWGWATLDAMLFIVVLVKYAVFIKDDDE